MSDLPAPLTPAECDLRGLRFMPLDVVRLLDSDLFAISTGEEFKAAVALWCKSWLQVPAASLPDDDRVLAHLSGAGPRWKKVRENALRGWIKCSDGRLYHPTVAEKAVEAGTRRGEWTEKENSKTERQKRWRQRCKALCERLRDAGVTPPKGASMETLEALCRRHNVDARVDGETSTVDAGEMPKTGTGTGTIPPKPPSTSKPSKPAKLPAAVRAVMEAGGFISPPPDLGLLDRWREAGADLEQDIVPVVRAVAKSVKERTGRAPFKLQLFDQPIREKLAADAAEIERLRAIQRRYGDPPEAAAGGVQ